MANLYTDREQEQDVAWFRDVFQKPEDIHKMLNTCTSPSRSSRRDFLVARVRVHIRVPVTLSLRQNRLLAKLKWLILVVKKKKKKKKKKN